MSDAPSQVQESTSAPLTVTISICKKCDAGRDPLTVPDKPCGHAPEGNRALVAVPVVPLADAEKLATALEEIKRTAAIEAPPVSDEVPAKAWKIAFDALNIWRAAYPREETTG